MAESRSKNRMFLALVSALLAIVPIAYFLFLKEPPPPPPPLPPPVVEVVKPPPPELPKPVEELQISEASGKVEVRRGQGNFEPAEVGAVLRADDALRTNDGKARLSAGGTYDINVEPGTTLEVKELTSTLSRFSLEDGMLTATVKEKANRTLEVAAKGTDAVARTTNGAFAMSSNGAGTVAVGARAGEVEFSAAGKAVLLRAGQQSVAQSPNPPSAPTPIPGSLLLKVAWPESELNKSRLEITGRTAPGAHVTLSGLTLKVEKDGRFSTTVRLREGKNSLSVEGVDVGGNRFETRGEVRVDTTAPDMQVRTGKLWK